MAVVMLLQERGRLSLSVTGASTWAGMQHDRSRVYNLHMVNTPAVELHGFFCLQRGRVWVGTLHYAAGDIDGLRFRPICQKHWEHWVGQSMKMCGIRVLDSLAFWRGLVHRNWHEWLNKDTQHHLLSQKKKGQPAQPNYPIFIHACGDVCKKNIAT